MADRAKQSASTVYRVISSDYCRFLSTISFGVITAILTIANLSYTFSQAGEKIAWTSATFPIDTKGCDNTAHLYFGLNAVRLCLDCGISVCANQDFSTLGSKNTDCVSTGRGVFAGAILALLFTAATLFLILTPCIKFRFRKLIIIVLSVCGFACYLSLPVSICSFLLL